MNTSATADTLRESHPAPASLEPACGADAAAVAHPVSRLTNILVPVDFSIASEKALTYAVSIARQFGAKITLLHVSQAQLYGCEFAYLPIEDDAMCQRIRELLDSLATGKVGPDLLADTVVRNGVPFDEIVKAAKELNSDLIVINTNGHTGLKHILLGSTAERVVRYAPCPVLVVRERQHDFV